MNTLMMTLQQPLSVAALAHCLGWAPAKARPVAARRRHGLRSRPAAPAGRRSGVDPQPPVQDDEAAAKGCGWFESSRDLHQGLLVLEHNGADSLGAELPVTVWLELVLDGLPGGAPAPAQRSMQA